MNVDSELVEFLCADMSEVLAEALAYFKKQFEENKEVRAAWGRVYWDLYEGIGYLEDEEDGDGEPKHTFDSDCALISDWLDELSYLYSEVEAYDQVTGELLWSNDERIYANDHKAAIVGEEIAHYV